MRIFNYFYLSLYHLTDENSLIFAATFLCRLTAPLSYNFLCMIHMDPAITKKIVRNQTMFTTVREVKLGFGETIVSVLFEDHGSAESYSDRFQRIQFLLPDVDLFVMCRYLLSSRVAMSSCVRFSTILRRR